METASQRIAWIIDNKCDGNRSKFARAINITPSYAAQLYANEREPSDRTISDVCRVFNVNKQWLLYGTGVKFMPSAEEDTAYINDLLSDLENPLYDTIKAILKAYAECSPEDKAVLKNFAKSFSDKIKKESRD